MSYFIDHAKYAISTARDVLQEDGISEVVKKGFLYYLPPIFLMPWWTSRANTIKKTGSIEAMIRFCFDEFFGVIRPGQIKLEISGLFALVKSRKPKTILEIGTCKGGTLFLWSCLLPKQGVIASIDLPYGKYGGGYHWWRVPFYKSFVSGSQQIHLIRANSHAPQTLISLKKKLGHRKVDFLFIDGDHSEIGVTADFDMYAPLVKKGGIIALHDIVDCTTSSECKVSRLWNNLKHEYVFRELIEDRNQGWGGIGVIFT